MKKFISFAAAFIVLASMIPYTVFAEDAGYAINEPNYNGDITISVPERCSNETRAAAFNKEEYNDTIEEGMAVLRKQMVDRKMKPVVKLEMAEFNEGDIIAATKLMFFGAMEHTGDPVEGDYLKWVWEKYSCEITGKNYNGKYYLTFTYEVSYYTTAEQEAELTERIEALKKDLALEGKTDYEKIKGIYDYMIANIAYDYEHLYDDSYKLKDTAYAALINGTAVCQGYAVLLYRLALEYDIDARIISGYSFDEPHGWNIVKLGDLYYYADSTWDAGMECYDFFLKGSESFTEHERSFEYLTEDFVRKYPVSEKDFDPENEGHDDPIPEHEYGLKYDDDLHWLECGKCGDKLDAEEHELSEWVQTKEPSSSETGERVRSCNVCEYDEIEIIPAVSDSENTFGDANGDNKVNVKDAVLVLQYANKKLGADKLDVTASDVTGDGKVNVKDAVMILQYANKKIDEFPAGA